MFVCRAAFRPAAFRITAPDTSILFTSGCSPDDLRTNSSAFDFDPELLRFLFQLKCFHKNSACSACPDPEAFIIVGLTSAFVMSRFFCRCDESWRKNSASHSVTNFEQFKYHIRFFDQTFAQAKACFPNRIELSHFSQTNRCFSPEPSNNIVQFPELYRPLYKCPLRRYLIEISYKVILYNCLRWYVSHWNLVESPNVVENCSYNVNNTASYIHTYVYNIITAIINNLITEIRRKKPQL